MSKRNWIIGGVCVVIVLVLYFALDARSKSGEAKSDLSFNNSLTSTSTGSNSNSNTVDNTQPVTDLKVETETAGTGEGAKAGDTVSVQYTGTLTNGQKFDSSYDHGQPFSFKLGAGGVIKGWDQGLLGMKVGEKRKLTIPASLGYGANANGPIPANSTLIFEVEMVKIAH